MGERTARSGRQSRVDCRLTAIEVRPGFPGVLRVGDHRSGRIDRGHERRGQGGHGHLVQGRVELSPAGGLAGRHARAAVPGEPIQRPSNSAFRPADVNSQAGGSALRASGCVHSSRGCPQSPPHTPRPRPRPGVFTPRTRRLRIRDSAEEFSPRGPHSPAEPPLRRRALRPCAPLEAPRTLPSPSAHLPAEVP